ncbi:MAG TPA: SiaB family protein kinase, partial [Bacteroidales bacterium]|nr:SiaB family protein kinase [Bacteroidales bacterium]
MGTSSNIKGGLLGFIYQFYSEMKAHKTIIVYEGEVSHELMKTLATLAERKMAARKEEMLVRQRVYHVMVECLQNITLHALDEEHTGEGMQGQHILMVTQSAEHYHVITGNPVSNAEAARLKDVLDVINQKPD